MKSNIIKINRETQNLENILLETKKVSEYAGLDTKQSLRNRLIAEEFIGMLKELAVDFQGEFYIEQQELSFKFVSQISINESMDMQKKKKFIELSSTRKNAVKGVMGKIRDVLENMLYPESAAYSSNFVAYQLENAALLGDYWTLSKYKDSVKDSDEPWDELEKSIIANIADDVVVAVKGKKVEIVISKKY